MASILLVSQHGDGIPLALRLSQDKHLVKCTLSDKRAKLSLRGFRNPSVLPAPKMLEQYDLILFDMVGLGNTADAMRKQGRTVLGSSTVTDSLELDRSYGEKVASQLTQLDIPDSVVIQKKKECQEYIRKASTPQVIKPLGNQSPSLTLVSKDKQNRAILSILDNCSDEVTPCLVQERIDGVEISSEGWFNGESFSPLFNHTIEHKRLMEGDIGPQTGCMGNVVWSTESDKLTERIFTDKLAKLLQRASYIGPIDANCILTEGKAYFLEWTARFGYDAIQAWLELVKPSCFDYLWKLATKQDITACRKDYAIAVRLTIPPYPHYDEEALDNLKDVELLSIPEAAQSHVWLSDVSMHDKTLRCAGVDGVLGCVTARGATITEARRRAYRTVSNIILHNDIQYRKDIGAGVESAIGTLKQWGWLNAQD